MQTYAVRRAVTLFVSVFGFFLLATSASAFNEAVIYETDFTNNPNWITDQPQNFYWDEAREAYFARTLNRPTANTSKSRYAYTETALNPRLSYMLQWDMQVLRISDEGNGSGVTVFGLFGDNLYGFNQYSLVFAGTEQDGSFSMRLMSLDRSANTVYTTANPGYNADTTVAHRRFFSVGTWYHFVLRYDASLEQYFFEMSNRDTGAIVLSYSILDQDVNFPVNPDLQNVGITMHPEGTGSTPLAQSARIDGYAEYLIDNVKVTQVYDETYTEPPSVFFLPGIQASRLYRDAVLGIEDRVWEPNNKDDVREIAMTETGESVEDIYTRDALGSVFGVLDIYDSWEDSLEALRQQGVISDWQTFAYDWRYAVDDVVDDGVKYETSIKNAVDEILGLAQRNNSKVTIVGHSNGGLVAKVLVSRLESMGKASLIDQIIFVGTPQLGTPKAIGALLHGYDQKQLGGWLLDEVTAREVMRNLPGVYGLLPGSAYLSDSEAVVQFSTSSLLTQFRDAYGGDIRNKDTLDAFLAATSDSRDPQEASDIAAVNAALLEDARILQVALDAWRAPLGVQVTEIVGVGMDTVKGFRYEEFVTKDCAVSAGVLVCSPRVYYEPVAQFTQYGDETVVAKSAEGYEGGKSTYYLDLKNLNIERNSVISLTHANLLSDQIVQNFIANQFKKINVPEVYFSTTLPGLVASTEIIAIHSPVQIQLKDSSGRVTGRGDDGAPVTEIPGSQYFEIGGVKYVTLPSATSYEAIVTGEGVYGAYTMTVSEFAGNGGEVEKFRFATATVTPDMLASFSKTSAASYSDVTIDYNGDGVTDTVYTLGGETPNYVLYESLRAVVREFALLKDSERSWLLSAIGRAEKTAIRKGDEASGVVRIFGQIDGRLVTYLGEGRIPQAQYDEVKRLMRQITGVNL